MKPTHARLTLSALGALALAASSAHAMDFKNYSPSVCQPYSTTTLPSELSFRAHGLKNISPNAEHVVCSILEDLDQPSRWTDANPGYVEVTVHASTNSTPRCELYLGSNLAGTTASYQAEATLTAGDSTDLFFQNVSAQNVLYRGGDQPPVALFCRMPPGASILQIVVGDSGPTS